MRRRGTELGRTCAEHASSAICSRTRIRGRRWGVPSRAGWCGTSVMRWRKNWTQRQRPQERRNGRAARRSLRLVYPTQSTPTSRTHRCSSCVNLQTGERCWLLTCSPLNHTRSRAYGAVSFPLTLHMAPCQLALEPRAAAPLYLNRRHHLCNISWRQRAPADCASPAARNQEPPAANASIYGQLHHHPFPRETFDSPTTALRNQPRAASTRWSTQDPPTDMHADSDRLHLTAFSRTAPISAS